jgi:DNA-binding MarR family transcriptional regulator
MRETSQKMSFIMNLWTLNTIISKKIDGKLGSIHGISFTEYMVLFHLKSSEAKSMRRIDLAEILGLTASGVTRLLSPMEKIGLIKKEINTRDARVSLVKITSSGERILNDATLGLEEVSNSILQNVTNSSLHKSLEAFQSINSERKIL